LRWRGTRHARRPVPGADDRAAVVLGIPGSYRHSGDDRLVGGRPPVITCEMATVTTIPGFGGELILPTHDAYDRSRAVWNGIVDRRPAAILRCASPEDVVAAVRFARDSDLEIAVKCGGHSVLGLSVPQGGVMIDLTP